MAEESNSYPGHKEAEIGNACDVSSFFPFYSVWAPVYKMMSYGHIKGKISHIN
jgi:hypothetical protein